MGTGLTVDDLAEAKAAGHQQDADYGHGERKFVTDHLGGAAQASQQRVFAVGGPSGKRDTVDAQSCDGEQCEDTDVEISDAEINVVSFEMQRIRTEGNHGDGSERQCKSQQRREIVDELIGTCRSRILFKKKFQPVSERLQQSVWADAVRSPARLNVRHHFALEPGEIGVDGQHHEKQDGDLDQRDEDVRVLGQEVVHDLVLASCSDSIMVQKRVRVPEVNRLSCAERISPAGTSYGAWPFLATCMRVGSALPVSSGVTSTL